MREWTWHGTDEHSDWSVDMTFHTREAAEHWATEPGRGWVAKDGGYLVSREVGTWERA